METAVVISLVVIGVAIAYFLSSGVAFALMYRIGERFPSQAASRLYQPLEWLSHRSSRFADLYNGLHRQCYRLFVCELVNNWAPPPPGIPASPNEERPEQQRGKD